MEAPSSSISGDATGGDAATSRSVDFFVPINITWRQTRQAQASAPPAATDECDSNKENAKSSLQQQKQQQPSAGPQTKIESIAWCLVPANRDDKSAAEASSQRRGHSIALSRESEAESLADIIRQIDESTEGANCLLVACGPLPLRQHLHPAAHRAKIELSPLYESYVDLSKEFARRYGHINPSSSPPILSASSEPSSATTGTHQHHQNQQVHHSHQYEQQQQQQRQAQQVASLCQCHCCDYYAACYAAAAEVAAAAAANLNESNGATQTAGGFANQMDFYNHQNQQQAQHEQQARLQPKEQQHQQQRQRSPISSISLRVDQMLKYLSIQCDDNQTPEVTAADSSESVQIAATSANANANDNTNETSDDNKLAANECCRLNSRLVDSMGKLVERMLSDGHQFARIERIKRRVEVGLCEHEPSEQEQRVVRARGLPWQATEQDIADFFVGLNIARGGVGLCLSRQGRRNGEALIQFESREHRNLALGRHKHFMGQRYIEVYRAGGEDFLSVATGYNNKALTFLSRGAQVIIRMRGLPFTCSAQQIVDFFSATHLLSQRNGYRNHNNNNHSNSNKDPAHQILKGCEVLGGEEGVLFVKNHDDKPTGDAFVLFATEQFAQRAIQKHHQNVGSRYVELFRSSVSEVQQVLSISTDPQQQQQQQQSQQAASQQTYNGNDSAKASRSSQQQKHQQQQQHPQVPQQIASSASWVGSQKPASSTGGFTWAQVATSGATTAAAAAAATVAKPLTNEAQEQQVSDSVSVVVTETKKEEFSVAKKRESEPRSSSSVADLLSTSGCSDDVNYPTLEKSGEHQHQSSAQSTDSSAFDNNSINSSSVESSSCNSPSAKSSSQDNHHDQSQQDQQVGAASSQLTPSKATKLKVTAKSADEMNSSPSSSSQNCGVNSQSPVSTLSAASSFKSSHHHHQNDASQSLHKTKHNRNNQAAASSQQQQQSPTMQHNQHRVSSHNSTYVKGNHQNNGQQARYWHQQQMAATGGQHQHHHNHHHHHQQQQHNHYQQSQFQHQQVPLNYDPNAHYMQAGRLYGHHQHQVTAMHPMAMAAYHQAFQNQAYLPPPPPPPHQQPQHARYPMYPYHQHNFAPQPHHIAGAAAATTTSGANTSDSNKQPSTSGSPNEMASQQQQQQVAGIYEVQQQATDGMDTSKRDCIRLRGLPFEAQVEDVLYFLGERGKSILYQGVHMVYSAQGQPTGEAVIQMNNCQSAAAAAQEYHKKVMTVGKKQRYIEVIPSSIDEMSPMLGLGAFMGHHHHHQPGQAAYIAAPAPPPPSVAPMSAPPAPHPMHLPYQPHYAHHHHPNQQQMVAGSMVPSASGAYSPTEHSSIEVSSSQVIASNDTAKSPASGATDTVPAPEAAINHSAAEVAEPATEGKPTTPVKANIESLPSSSSVSTTSDVMELPQVPVVAAAAPQASAAAHTNLVPAAAAHTAAAYYPILYYYPHQQMVASPYQ